jgi:hypothetical protein
VREMIFLLVPCLWLAVAAGSSAAFQGKTAPRGCDLPIDSRTVLGIVLGHSDLTGVGDKLGPAKIWSQGHASNPWRAICYVTAEPRSVAIIFASDAEMAGSPNNDVTDIIILRSEAYPLRSKCRSLPIPADDVQTPSGLRLGISWFRIKQILGPSPTLGPILHARPGPWEYVWSVDEFLPKSDKNYAYWLSRKEECFGDKQPFFTVNSQIDFRLKGDIVYTLTLRRIERICYLEEPFRPQKP